MATSPRNLVPLAVAFALAVPALAAAQRTASSSSSSSSTGETAAPRSTAPSSSSGSGGGSSSSERSVGSSSSSSSSAGSSQVSMPEMPAFRSSYTSSSSSGQRTAPPGSSTGSTASPRSSGSSGSSSSSGGSTSSSSGSSGSSASSPRGSNNGSSLGRSRDGRPVAGIATPRETIDINGLSFPVYGPSFARWYPFGATGFGWNLGYVNYDPFFYSRSPWMWGWNGLWYDPYDPFGYNSWYGYNPYGYGYGPGYSNSYGYGGSSKSSDESEHVGSIRLRVNPSEAQVYVDGALMGVVDDFDGFSSHLKLAAGNHKIELKADGYQPYSGNVFVSVGKTVTERISLKKK